MRLAAALLIVVALTVGTAQGTAAGENDVVAPGPSAAPVVCSAADGSTTSSSTTAVIGLDYAVVDDLLPVLRDLLEDERGLPLRLVGDRRTHSLVAAGAEDSLDLLRGLVTDLDIPVFHGHPHSPARVLDLQRADAVEVAAVVTRLIQSAPQLWRCTRRGPLPTVAALAADNRLIVQGDPEARKLVTELIESLDAVRDEAPAMKEAVETAVLLLEYVAVDRIEPVLRELYPTDAAEPLRFAIDSHANALHAVAPPRLLDRLRRTVAQLDVLVCFGSLPWPVHVVELKHADAVETADALTRLIRSSPRMWQLHRHDPVPTVIADPAGNRLLVQGDEFGTTRIRDLAEQLDDRTDAPEPAERAAHADDG